MNMLLGEPITGRIVRPSGLTAPKDGTGYLLQYPPDYQEKFAAKETCPDELLLFFHRLPYDYVMRDGRTLIRRIYDDHKQGAEEAEAMQASLQALEAALPADVYTLASRRMQLQIQNAREWRDVLLDFFCRLSGVEPRG